MSVMDNVNVLFKTLSTSLILNAGMPFNAPLGIFRVTSVVILSHKHQRTLSDFINQVKFHSL